MLKRNNFAIGFFAALLLPGLVGFIFEYLLKGKVIFNNKPLIPYLIVLAINLFIIKYWFKTGMDQTGAGAILSSFIVMLSLFYIQRYL